MKARTWWAAWRYVAVEAAAGFGSLLLVVVGLLLAIPLAVGATWPAAPALDVLHRWSGAARQRAGRHLRTDLPPYWPGPPRHPSSVEARRALTARETRVEVGWLLLSALLGSTVGLLLVVLPLAAANAWAMLAYWPLLPAGAVQGLIAVTSWATALAGAAIGVLYAGLSWWATPAAARAAASVTAAMLTPSQSERLSRRVEALSASRAAALDAHASELRRIERDLHDGAQNRLVGVVMMVGLARRALDQDTGRAAELMDRAAEAAKDALGTLRTSVHDIYPPILDELGLEGALSALAGRSAVPCALSVHGVQRLPAAVESAAYFVVAEALTNVAKYSGARECAVEMDARDDLLSMRITDDGTGGAVEHEGGGLAGIRRRVAAFEGTTQVDSPAGGPTTITVVLPCAW